MDLAKNAECDPSQGSQSWRLCLLAWNRALGLDTTGARTNHWLNWGGPKPSTDLCTRPSIAISRRTCSGAKLYTFRASCSVIPISDKNTSCIWSIILRWEGAAWYIAGVVDSKKERTWVLYNLTIWAVLKTRLERSKVRRRHLPSLAILMHAFCISSLQSNVHPRILKSGPSPSVQCNMWNDSFRASNETLLAAPHLCNCSWQWRR